MPFTTKHLTLTLYHYETKKITYYYNYLVGITDNVCPSQGVQWAFHIYL